MCVGISNSVMPHYAEQLHSSHRTCPACMEMVNDGDRGLMPSGDRPVVVVSPPTNHRQVRLDMLDVEVLRKALGSLAFRTDVGLAAPRLAGPDDKTHQFISPSVL